MSCSSRTLPRVTSVCLNLPSTPSTGAVFGFKQEACKHTTSMCSTPEPRTRGTLIKKSNSHSNEDQVVANKIKPAAKHLFGLHLRQHLSTYKNFPYLKALLTSYGIHVRANSHINGAVSRYKAGKSSSVHLRFLLS